MNRRRLGVVALAFMASTPARAHTSGIPPAYKPLVVEPRLSAGRSEFDLGPALARAQREKKRLYVYLGADDCPYCRRYETFLAKNAGELVPHFKPWLVVDLRSSLSTTQGQLYFRVGNTSLVYADFQRSINDERARMLVYPSVWLFDAQMKPLMPMPAGTGTFETVEEQLEILNLVQ
ncbi:thioredoxin family protein [Sphaerotilaceae bacterium SBD11-9]